MTKTLQRKFVVTSMIAVTVLLALLLGLLNGFNAWSNARQSERLTEVLLRQQSQGGPGEGLPPDGPREGDAPPALPEGRRDERELEDLMGRRGFLQEALTENDTRAALFFTVFLSADGEAEVDLGRTASVTEAEAAEMAQSLAEAGKTSGRRGSYRYASEQAADGGTVYVFLDVSAGTRSVLRVALLSLLLGLAAWGLMLLLVILLSKKAIRPIAENMEKQRHFVTDAGHEIKTPLAIIQANAEALELHEGENKYTKNIREQVGRLSGLMQDLLTLARADGQASLHVEAVDLSAAAEQTLQGFQTPMELRGLRADSELAPELSVSGDRTLLTRLISILADNAVKYAAENSLIRFRLFKAEKQVCFQAANRCDALPDCAPEQLFDRFYRADAARTQKQGGYGIGLSAARAIAEAHKGSIAAAYGEDGTITFTVKLPAK